MSNKKETFVLQSILCSVKPAERTSICPTNQVAQTHKPFPQNLTSNIQQLHNMISIFSPPPHIDSTYHTPSMDTNLTNSQHAIFSLTGTTLSQQQLVLALDYKPLSLSPSGVHE
jgi:hypothetical protein